MIDLAAHLPRSFADAGIAVRAETPADIDALRAIYIELRAPEFAMAPEPAKSLILNQQFDIQRGAYRQAHPAAAFLTIMNQRTPIGRIYLADIGADIALIDILIAASERGRGVGGALIEAVKAEAFARGGGVLLHVDKSNRARQLYARLGFVITGDDGVRYAMYARA